ncbi:hypothetical protein M0802_007619 [Mischocyttarus mexicanus]|nr:hypothetical protein M0802_007619 [Mischocyttarus mexicanus]
MYDLFLNVVWTNQRGSSDATPPPPPPPPPLPPPTSTSTPTSANAEKLHLCPPPHLNPLSLLCNRTNPLSSSPFPHPTGNSWCRYVPTTATD